MYNNNCCMNTSPCKVTPIVCPERVVCTHCTYYYNQPVIVPMMARSETTKLIEYWTKNLVRFESYQVSKYGNESFLDNRTMFHFQSKNYPISDKEVYYSEYDCYIKHVHTSNPGLFWKKPIVLRWLYENTKIKSTVDFSMFPRI